MRSLSTRITYLLKGKGPPLEVTFNLEDILKEMHKDQATVIWPSLFGGPDSGLDCGTGLWDWTVGLDSQKVALIISGD